jgi:hypothetical protein
MFWFDAHGGAGVWRKRVRETNTRVARGVGAVVTKGPISSKCAAWDVFEKDGKNARRRPWPVLSVSSSAQSLGAVVVALTLLSYWQRRYEIDLWCPGT